MCVLEVDFDRPFNLGDRGQDQEFLVCRSCRFDIVAHPSRILGLNDHVIIPRVSLGFEVDRSCLTPK